MVFFETKIDEENQIKGTGRLFLSSGWIWLKTCYPSTPYKLPTVTRKVKATAILTNIAFSAEAKNFIYFNITAD